MREFKAYNFHLHYLLGNKLDHRERFTIHQQDPHIQSPAMLLLLKHHYHKISERSEGKIPLETRIWLNFRNRFLKKMKKEVGSLICFYCQKPDLTANINSPNAHNRKATIDHFIPTTKGGKKYDEKNLRVCCENCNSKKKDLMPEVFLAKIQKPKKVLAYV